MNSNDRQIEAERIRREQDAAAAQRRRAEEEDRARRQRDADERDRRNREEQDRQRRQREQQQALDRQKKRQAETGCFVGATPVQTERVEPVFNLLTDVDHTFVAAGCVVHNFTYFRKVRVWWHRAMMLSDHSQPRVEIPVAT